MEEKFTDKKKPSRTFLTASTKREIKKNENIFKMMFYMIYFSILGFKTAFKEEKSFILHFCLGFCLPIITEIILQVDIIHIIITATIGCMLLAIELINSAIENAVDLTTEEYNLLAKKAKDLASAAVFTIGLLALIVNVYFILSRIIELYF